MSTKNWIILAGAFLLLILLAVRGLYKTVSRVDEEKKWYVSELNLKCTLKIDSIAIFGGTFGALYCDLLSGEVDNNTEFQLNQKLLHHKRIRFLTYRPDGHYALFSRRANKYLVGDSLKIDSSQDQIIFYRGGQEIWKAQITNSLRDRIF